MAVNGSIANEEGDSILISLVSPYENIKSVLSFSDQTIGEDSESFFYKEFRWSKNNVTYSDYVELTNANLQALDLDSNDPFWIEYRYTVAELFTGEELEFVSISLEVETEQGTIQVVPQIECCDGGEGDSCANLVVECCDDNRFNPYNLSKATNNYKQLSQLASDMFGHCVTYFRTDGKASSKDVILKEYSLYDVAGKEELNILVPDNELPTREIQFTMFDMDLPDIFEIHIVKSEFETLFGVGKRPSQFDYLWFPLVDKMFEVNSIALPDDFFHEATYYRVNLSLYKDRKNRDYTEAPEIEEEIDDLIDSAAELFGEEADQEKDRIRKPDQYTPVGSNEYDGLRSYLNRALIIKEDRIVSNYTIISKHYYQLNSLGEDELGVTYKHKTGFSETDNRSMVFLTRPQFTTPQGSNIAITDINFTTDGKVIFTTSSEHEYEEDDLVRILGTQDYNGIKRITAVSSFTFTIEASYVSDVAPNPRSSKEEKVQFFTYEIDSEYFRITYTTSAVIVDHPEKTFVYDLSADGDSIENDKWYGIVLNISNEFKQMSLFVHRLDQRSGYNPTKDGEFSLRYSKTLPLLTNYSLDDGGDWKLYAAPADLTNIRIFENPIEEEEQSLVLSQYVVNDSHLSLIVDNAIPEMRTVRKNNPR